jgi:hypothetical protein
MAYARKDQSRLSDAEWSALIDAINGLHGTGAPSPAYREFVAVHVDAMTGVGMAWGVHTRRAHRGGLQPVRRTDCASAPALSSPTHARGRRSTPRTWRATPWPGQPPCAWPAGGPLYGLLQIFRKLP